MVVCLLRDLLCSRFGRIRPKFRLGDIGRSVAEISRSLAPGNKRPPQRRRPPPTRPRCGRRPGAEPCRRNSRAISAESGASRGAARGAMPTPIRPERASTVGARATLPHDAGATPCTVCMCSCANVCVCSCKASLLFHPPYYQTGRARLLGASAMARPMARRRLRKASAAPHENGPPSMPDSAYSHQAFFSSSIVPKILGLVSNLCRDSVELVSNSGRTNQGQVRRERAPCGQLTSGSILQKW